MAVLGESLTQKRDQIVRDHVDAENSRDYEAALATFDRPRYEFVATDEVFDGPDEVMAHWEELDRAFPDQLDEIIAIHHADDVAILEFISRGTHLGTLRGLPATGRRFELPASAIFVFEGDRLVCERVYFDTGTFYRQLGVERDPLSLGGRLETVARHPLVIGRGLVRRVAGR
jgi:steroid delta-isomerase-like uncharacterized protein